MKNNWAGLEISFMILRNKLGSKVNKQNELGISMRPCMKKMRNIFQISMLIQKACGTFLVHILLLLLHHSHQERLRLVLPIVVRLIDDPLQGEKIVWNSFRLSLSLSLSLGQLDSVLSLGQISLIFDVLNLNFYLVVSLLILSMNAMLNVSHFDYECHDTFLDHATIFLVL